MPVPSGKKRKPQRRDSEGTAHDPSVRGVRRTARDITRVSDLYGGGETGRLMASDITSDPKLQRKVTKLLQRRHEAVAAGIGPDGIYRRGKHEWKVPAGVRMCIKVPLVWGQITNQYPWYVTWISKTDGKRKRKFFATALGGINFIATKAQYVDPQSALVSRQVGYDIPAKLRGKLPKPWRWCPHCMTARKFRRRKPDETFYAERKEWSEEKQKFVWIERKLAVLECPTCHGTNRDTKMRRSNQPWEVRRIKPAVRRVVKRKR